MQGEGYWFLVPTVSHFPAKSARHYWQNTTLPFVDVMYLFDFSRLVLKGNGFSTRRIFFQRTALPFFSCWAFLTSASHSKVNLLRGFVPGALEGDTLGAGKLKGTPSKMDAIHFLGPDGPVLVMVSTAL